MSQQDIVVQIMWPIREGDPFPSGDILKSSPWLALVSVYNIAKCESAT